MVISASIHDQDASDIASKSTSPKPDTSGVGLRDSNNMQKNISSKPSNTTKLSLKSLKGSDELSLSGGSGNDDFKENQNNPDDSLPTSQKKQVELSINIDKSEQKAVRENQENLDIDLDRCGSTNSGSENEDDDEAEVVSAPQLPPVTQPE